MVVEFFVLDGFVVKLNVVLALLVSGLSPLFSSTQYDVPATKPEQSGFTDGLYAPNCSGVIPQSCAIEVQVSTDLDS